MAGPGELMEQSSRYYYEPRASGPDSIGSALGLYRCANHIGKEAYIVLKESNATIEYLMRS